MTAYLEMNGLQRRMLRETILQTFKRAELEILVADTLDKSLGSISKARQFKALVFELISWADRHTKLADLARAVAGARPLFDRGLAFAEPAPAAPPSSAGVKLREASILEGLVRNGEGIDRYGPMMERFLALQGQVCRFEGATFGTGFLVAPDLVLTNFHVIEENHEAAASGDNILCRFDYLSESSPGIPVRLVQSQWCMAHSRYASADEGDGDDLPHADELDYALLKLERPVGDDKVNGRSRGYVRMSGSAKVPGESRILFIAQHPEAAPLSSSWGLSRGLASGNLRFRYTAETLGGSSGSPVFDGDLGLVALHHAGQPGSKLRRGDYNQGIPIALIAADLAKKESIRRFWE